MSRPETAFTNAAWHGAELRTHPAWRCVCGRIVKAFDFQIEPDEIKHTCGHCHARLLTIELLQPTVGET